MGELKIFILISIIIIYGLRNDIKLYRKLRGGIWYHDILPSGSFEWFKSSYVRINRKPDEDYTKK